MLTVHDLYIKVVESQGIAPSRTNLFRVGCVLTPSPKWCPVGESNSLIELGKFVSYQ